MTTREQGQPTSAPLKIHSSRKMEAKTQTWNVPDSILLDPTQSLTIGRTPSTDVMLHSPKMPSMLSRKHAAITFDSDKQQWSIEDLQVLLFASYWLPFCTSLLGSNKCTSLHSSCRV